MYNGKTVFDCDNFDLNVCNVGDYVRQEVVDDFMNLLPPACQTSACAQLGEPYSERYDSERKKYRNTYVTFKRVTYGDNAVWQYCGHCFCGETVERGTEPPYIVRRESSKCS